MNSISQKGNGVGALFLGISSFQLIAMFRRGLFYTFLSIYLRAFLGLGVTESTLFAAISMSANVIGQMFVWGRVSDKFQLRRTLVICGELCGGVGTLLLWYAHRMPSDLRTSAYVIIIGLSIIEFFWSMSNVGWSALLSDVYAEEERGAIQGKLATVGGIGRIIGVWIGGVLYDALGYQYAGWGFREGSLFFVAAGAMFVSIVPMLMVPEGGIRRESHKAESRKAAPGSLRMFTLFIVGMVFVNFGRNSITVTFSQYLTLADGFALSGRVLGYVVNAHSVAMVIVGLLLASVLRRFGNYRTLLLGIVLGIVSLMLLICARSVIVLFTCNLFLGSADVMIMASSYALASALIPADRRATLFGAFNAARFLSWGLAGTIIAGPVIDGLLHRGVGELEAYRISFVTGVLITVIGLVIHLFLAKKLK